MNQSSVHLKEPRHPVCTLIVPCYNEAKRLNRPAFEAFFLAYPEIHWVFVNDGSRDETLKMLQALRGPFAEQVQVLDRQPNRGKAEAVRAGLLHAIAEGRTPLVGFWDADLATPLETIADFLGILANKPTIDMVFGARVKLLGREVERRAIRHYLGRIFATAASTLLRLPIYDTQCGAKVFRVNPLLATTLEEPFRSRWVFDVEIIARLIRARNFQIRSVESCIYELPLPVWKDVGGSKVRPSDFVKAFFDIYRIWWHYLRRP